MFILEDTAKLMSEGTDPRAELSNRRKAQQSKLKSLTNQLQNLLQKKIRIDLEIRSTRKKLSKLKGSSATTLRASLTAEGFDLSLEPIPVEILQETISSELIEELKEFDSVLDEADYTLSLIKDLPLYNNN